MIQIPLEPFLVWLMVFLRTAFVLSFFPILGDTFLPVRIRVMACAAIAVTLCMVVPVTAADFPRSGGGIASLVVCEGLLGLGLAFIGRVMFAVIQFSGQIVGQEIGFGLVNAIDPTSHQISVVAEMQYLLAVLIFFAADLHHLVLQALVHSFELLKPGAPILTAGVVDFMMRLGATLFSLSIGFAMPVVAINFALNIALGMISRAVPQMNVFVESFPLRIIAGVSVLLLSLGFTVTLWERMFGQLGTMMGQVMKLMR